MDKKEFFVVVACHSALFKGQKYRYHTGVFYNFKYAKQTFEEVKEVSPNSAFILYKGTLEVEESVSVITISIDSVLFQTENSKKLRKQQLQAMERRALNALHDHIILLKDRK